MKISVFGLFLRIIIVGLIVFAIYLLLIQFIFSYLNQDINGPRLTFTNFAGPFLITILILIFAGFKLVFKSIWTKIPVNFIVLNTLTILLFALAAWQTWYIVTLYKIHAGSNFNGKFTELMPMTVGLLTTLFFMTIALRRKHAS